MKTVMATWKRSVLQAVVVAGCASASIVVLAAESVVLVKGEGQTITSADVVADAARIPENVRSGFLAQPNTVQELATNLYVRRVMAEQGKQSGVDKLPDVVAAVKIAVDKIISDAYLVKFNADNTPKDGVLEAQAKAQYQAKKDTYVDPAKVHASHILIMGKGDETEAKALAVLQQLKSGGDFAAIAKKESQDPGSAEKGGDLGEFAKGKMVPQFEEAAFSLKEPGDMTGLVKSQFGFHIIKLISKTPEKQRSYEEVAPMIKKEITESLLGKARQAVVKKVTDGMIVEKTALETFSKQYDAK